ncbi:hypothetical protein [Phyllobacterium sp. YR531]|uniref:hypothetical protein n=1 Tax=Phyllobacterium sp. YR531 TaxID=1144343 RepID=UPI00026F5B4C|nr:hypothetical protein [Phyllobacterium sp. YR531]EJN04464.1 hypothetical protein PMI41_02105 [Phyllobacterium sp. YR531]
MITHPTRLQNMSGLLTKILDAQYHSYMPDDAMDNLRDAVLSVVDSIVEDDADSKEDRQAKLDAIITLTARNQESAHTREITRIVGSLDRAAA